MRLISWNVNGLRACLNKGFLDFCALADADVICLQETKMRPEQASFELEGYQRFWNSADKAGYSGTAVFTRRAPLSVTYDFGGDVHRHEGRVITAEFEDFYLVCCYTPNSKDQLARLDYRMEWEDDIRAYLTELDAQKPVVYCGDLNVAHQEIDLKNPQSNRMNPGFSDEERAKMTQLLSSGFVDTLPRPVPRPHRCLLLVELPLPRPGEQRRMAHRLFHRVPAADAPGEARRHLAGDHRQRPLPRGTGAGRSISEDRTGAALRAAPAFYGLAPVLGAVFSAIPHFPVLASRVR